MSAYFEEKSLQFSRALLSLKNALRPNPNDLEIDGAIQRFEYCFELAWKTLKLRLEEDGITDLSSPKAALRKGIVAGLIENEEEWLTMLNDRNLTVHTYDEQTASDIFQRLPAHLAAFEALSASMAKTQ